MVFTLDRYEQAFHLVVESMTSLQRKMASGWSPIALT